MIDRGGGERFCETCRVAMATEKKVAVVTGASRGLGRALALELAASGFHVVGLARHFSAGESRGREELGGRLVWQRCDVADSERVRECYGSIAERFGRLDLLVNNAGVGRFASLDETDEGVWGETIGTNLTGAFLQIRYALPLLRAAGGGLIVNINSIAALQGFERLSAYCASKAGLMGLSRAVAQELRHENIHVMNVFAGAIATSFWEQAAPPGDWRKEEMIPEQAAVQLIFSAIRMYPAAVVQELVLMPRKGIF